MPLQATYMSMREAKELALDALQATVEGPQRGARQPPQPPTQSLTLGRDGLPRRSRAAAALMVVRHTHDVLPIYSRVVEGHHVEHRLPNHPETRDHIAEEKVRSM